MIQLVLVNFLGAMFGFGESFTSYDPYAKTIIYAQFFHEKCVRRIIDFYVL